MSEMTSGLVERIEAATGPDRDFDKSIARTIGFFNGSRASYDLQLNLIPKYTASIDAAMTLVPEGCRPNEILHEAVSRLSRQWSLHIRFWPQDQPYSQWLARFICAAALRARAPLPAPPAKDTI